MKRNCTEILRVTLIHLQTPFMCSVLTHTGITLVSIFCSFIVWWINHEPTFLAHATFYFPQASNLAKLHCLHFLRPCKQQRPKFEEKLFLVSFFPILSAFFTQRLLTGREFVLFWSFLAFQSSMSCDIINSLRIETLSNDFIISYGLLQLSIHVKELNATVPVPERTPFFSDCDRN